MVVATALARRVDRLLILARQRTAAESPRLVKIRQDPAQLMNLGGMRPDPWQVRLLRSSSTRTLILCSRQVGKSTVAAALALKTALLRPPATVLIVSRAQRQSAELLRKVKELYRGLRGERLRRKAW